MSRPTMRPGTRPSKEMLSTRIPSPLYDRVREYAIRSRYTIEEITTKGLEMLLDAEAPDLRAKFPAEPEIAPGTTGNPATDADARIDALEAKLDRVLSALDPRTKGRRRAS
jgi:hypothetical protein